MTVNENLRKLAEEVKGSLIELINEHSTLYLSNPPGSGFFTASGNYSWRDLDPSGKRVQAKLLSQYRHLYALLSTLLQGLSKEDLSSFEKSHKTITKRIEQSGRTWSKSKDEELDKATVALDKMLGLLDHLFGGTEGKILLVPDTNALLYNPVLESWEFSDFSRFCLILTPAVLSELDRLKIIHKNQAVRTKAERLIRQLKEYRRRGDWFVGVALRKNVSSLMAVAREPSLPKSLPWLQQENNDDRLIASVIEVMRDNPRANVYLVSRDLNVQNKAAYAGIPDLEPPEPPKPSRKPRQTAKGGNV